MDAPPHTPHTSLNDPYFVVLKSHSLLTESARSSNQVGLSTPLMSFAVVFVLGVGGRVGGRVWTGVGVGVGVDVLSSFGGFVGFDCVCFAVDTAFLTGFTLEGARILVKILMCEVMGREGFGSVLRCVVMANMRSLVIIGLINIKSVS